MRAFLEEQFNHEEYIGMLIECALSIEFDINEILSIWNSESYFYIRQVCYLFEHFDCEIIGDLNPKGCYFKDSDKIEMFLELLRQQISEEKIYEINAYRHV